MKRFLGLRLGNIDDDNSNKQIFFRQIVFVDLFFQTKNTRFPHIGYISKFKVN